jgi:hypothetical protein
MHRTILPVLLTLIPAALLAQYSDTTRYYAGYTSGGTFNKTTEKSSFLLNNGLRLGVRKKKIVMNSASRWLYGSQNGTLTNNDLSSSWDGNLYKAQGRFYYWCLLNYNASYSLKINNQLQAGGGIAYNIINYEAFRLNVSNGLLYEYSDIILGDLTQRMYSLTRNSFRILLRLSIRQNFTFSGNIFFQNSLSDISDHIIKSEVNMSFKVWKWLSLTTAMTYNRISRTGGENFFITYGLTVERYF